VRQILDGGAGDATGVIHRPKLNPDTFHRRIPLLPHQMADRVTPADAVIVLCHLGVPHIAASDWSLQIDGLVSRPKILTFAELLAFPKHSVETVHQCAGSPLAPTEPTRRICNVVWGGARLVDLLADCGRDSSAKYIWSKGADYGKFDGLDIDAYEKDIPVERLGDDVLVAYELNGKPLTPEHGFPARLVVPGFYGTNSVKWLTNLRLEAGRARGLFTTRWYNDQVLDASGQPTGETTPVWEIAPESVIVSPAPDALLEAGVTQEVWGWSWADQGITEVRVGFGDPLRWHPAKLEKKTGRGWQRFSTTWIPASPGKQTIRSLARSSDGAEQPWYNRRNAVHSVSVTVI
jgi:sulfane dehydrogenase subunit SoxC